MKRNFTLAAGLTLLSLIFSHSTLFASGTPTEPIKFISFEGAVSNKSVVLSWVTEETANPDYFEVERSFNGVDFFTAGIVLDGFEDGAQKKYAFKENAEQVRSKGTVYYRLKYIYLKEAGTISKTVSVQMPAEQNSIAIATPNPFTDKVKLSFESPKKGNAEVRILNANGTVVYTGAYAVSKGNNSLQITNLNNLKTGVYVTALFLEGTKIATSTIVK